MNYINKMNSNKTFQFQIISAPFSCGISWLVNVFLESQIKMTRISVPLSEAQWHKKEDGSFYLSEKEWLLQRDYFQILQHNNIKFRSDIEGFWEHRLFMLFQKIPTIIFFRDIRDAIYSYYMRHYKEKFTYEEYLNDFTTYPIHLGDMFFLPPPETFCYFYLFTILYLNFVQQNFIIINFKDAKLDSYNTIKRVLSYLKLKLDNKVINNIISGNSLPDGSRFGRKGVVNEWEKTHSKKALERFDTNLIRFTMELLNNDEKAKDFCNITSIENINLPRKITIPLTIDDSREKKFAHIISAIDEQTIKNKSEVEIFNLILSYYWAYELLTISDMLPYSSNLVKQIAKIFYSINDLFLSEPSILKSIRMLSEKPVILHTIKNFHIIRFKFFYYLFPVELVIDKLNEKEVNEFVNKHNIFYNNDLIKVLTILGK